MDGWWTVAAGTLVINDRCRRRGGGRRESREPLELPLGISVFNHDVAALDVTAVTQSLTEGLGQVVGSRQVARQVAYSRDFPRRLRLGDEWHRDQSDHERNTEPERSDSHGALLCHVTETRSTMGLSPSNG